MAKLIYDARAYSSGRTYEEKGITFTSDGYIITHGIVYNATGTATSIEAGTVVNLVGAQATGAIPYLTITGSGNNAVETTSFLEAPTTNGFVLKFNTSTNKPYWAADNNTTYKLSLNGTTNGTSGGTSLGTLFAPTTAGTQYQILQSNGSGAPSWVTLVTEILSTYGSETYGVPTAKAVRDAITSGFAANDAMVFAGTLKINSSSKLVFVSHNPNLNFGVTITDNTTTLDTITNYSAGWTFRVVTSDGATDIGTVEIGDLIVAYKDITSSTYNKNDFTVVQNNINGALTEANLNGTNSGFKRKVYLESSNLYVDLITRAIKVDGTQKLANSTTTAINFISGKGITLTYGSTAGDLTIALNVASQYDSENTSTGLGGIKLKSATSSVATSSITNPTASGGGNYEVHVNADGVAYVNVPWVNNTYTLTATYSSGLSISSGMSTLYVPIATSSRLGVIKPLTSYTGKAGLFTGTGNVSNVAFSNNTSSAVNYINKVTTETGRFYAITTDSNGYPFVNVPWVNTWRPIYAYTLGNDNSRSASQIRSSSTGTNGLSFGGDFVAKDVSNDSNMPDSEIHLCWAEVDNNGNVTYTT